MQALYYLILDPLQDFSTLLALAFLVITAGEIQNLWGLFLILCHLSVGWGNFLNKLGQDPAQIPEPIFLRILAEVHLLPTKFGLEEELSIILISKCRQWLKCFGNSQPESVV